MTHLLGGSEGMPPPRNIFERHFLHFEGSFEQNIIKVFNHIFNSASKSEIANVHTNVFFKEIFRSKPNAEILNLVQ